MEARMKARLTMDDILRERMPATQFIDADLETLYWLDESGGIRYRHYPLKGAHVPTFRWYLGAFAKDQKACYCVNTRLAKADPKTFRMLNYCFAKDSQMVWTTWGRIANADAGTFEACDDGTFVEDNFPSIITPYGYGKDSSVVYYASYGDKPTIVKGADPATFVSFGEGRFGKDDRRVYTAGRPIPKADAVTWRPLGKAYSCDAKRVFFQKDPLAGADPASFQVHVAGPNAFRVAKDRSRFYLHNEEITAAAYEQFAAGKRSWSDQG
jgi:hypothetical protein